MTSTTFADHIFLANIARIKAQHADELSKLIADNGRINSSVIWPSKYGGVMSFEKIDDFEEFVKGVYDHMLEETIGGYCNSRISIPGIPYTIMDIDFYLGEKAARESNASKDLVDVRLRVVDTIAENFPCPNKEYHVVICHETRESDIKDVFTDIKNYFKIT